MTTAGEIREMLKDVPADFEVKVCITCRFMHDGVYVDKAIWQTKVSMSRQMVILDAEPVEFGPK